MVGTFQNQTEFNLDLNKFGNNKLENERANFTSRVEKSIDRSFQSNASAARLRPPSPQPGDIQGSFEEIELRNPNRKGLVPAAY